MTLEEMEKALFSRPELLEVRYQKVTAQEAFIINAISFPL